MSGPFTTKRNLDQAVAASGDAQRGLVTFVRALARLAARADAVSETHNLHLLDDGARVHALSAVKQERPDGIP